MEIVCIADRRFNLCCSDIFVLILRLNIIGAAEEKNLRKNFPKSKLKENENTKFFSSSESRIKESMERKYTLLKLFPTFSLTNEVSGLSNEP